MTNVALAGFLILLSTASVRCQTLQNMKDLYTKLFVTEKYNKFIRPVENQTNAIVVTVTLHLSSIIDFNEQEESLTTAGYLSLTWIDDSLTWDVSDYGGVGLFFMPQDQIWTPDITLRNSFEPLAGLGYEHLNVWISPNGRVQWDPFQLLRSTCDVDITYFPFDTQKCMLKFTAWSYDQAHLHLLIDTGGKVIINSDYSHNSQWYLVDSSVDEDRSDSTVTFTLTLERKPNFYVINIIVPVVMLSFLNIFIFALPVKSGERASFAITVFLSMAVFLTIVASELPKNSDVVSLLGLYLLAMSIQSTVIALMSVLEIRLAMRDDMKDVPKIGATYGFIGKLASTSMCRCSCCNRRRRQKVEDSSIPIHPSTDLDNVCKPNSDDDVSLSWNDVVEAIDFLSFWITSIITIIVTVIFFVLSINNPQKTENIYSDLDNGLLM